MGVLAVKSLNLKFYDNLRCFKVLKITQGAEQLHFFPKECIPHEFLVTLTSPWGWCKMMSEVHVKVFHQFSHPFGTATQNEILNEVWSPEKFYFCHTQA